MSRLGIFFSLLLAVLVVAVIMPAPPVPADQGGVPHVPDEVLIKYKVNTTQAEKDQIRGEIHGQKTKAWGRIRAELNHLQDGVTVGEAIARLQGNPHVEYVEPNYIVTINETPNDPLFPQLWGMENTGQTGGTPGADIHATNAWDVFTGSDSVLVGVIDTGVDYTHPDLAANIWTNPGEIPGNGIDDDGNGFIDDIHGWDFYNDDNDPMDDHGHGSHVSGTIGAVGNNGIGVAGVNWHIKIMGIKFLSSGGSGSTDDAVDAIYYATMMGVRLTSNSWGGGGYSQTLYDAIQDAGAHNILFVAASGNDGANTDVSPHYPSAYDLPNIVSVAATDHNDELAGFSNYGATTVDLGAPGVDILSTFPGNSYGSISGTSMATPHVSGALGLIFGRFPNIGALDAKNLLLNFADPIPSLAGKCLTEARLNAFLPIAEPDSIPPGAITDLAVTTVASNWMDIAWTAPGDDGYTGTASRYDVRYSTSPITELNFGAATAADNPPDPGPAGTPETMHVTGLDFSTTYYFAVKGLDEFGNAGSLSNVPSGTTLGPPDIDVTPTSLTETLLTGATSIQNLTLSNLNANTTLDFDIPLPELVTSPVEVQAFVDIPKGGVDARTGEPVVTGTGGPDAFGYRWVDSDEPYGPVFQWTDISGTGTAAITTGDDVNSGPFSIGFTFPFYGVDYTDFRVCSNGFVSLTSTSTAYSNQPLPNGGAPPTLIAPFWDDLVVSTGSSVYYESDGSTLIVQWNGVTHYGGGGPYSFQAILHDDGSIEYQYLSIGSPDNSATVGIQNSAQTDGLQVVFNTTYVHDNLAVRIQAVPQWMTVAPSAGSVFGPGSTNLAVTFDAEGLLGGTYDGTIHVGSNDPDENPFDIPVTLTVIGAPDIAVEPLSYDFGQVFLGATPSYTFVVRNPGTDTLHVSSVSVSDPAYTPSLSTFAIPPRSSLGLDVTFAPVAVQLYPATMTIASDDPDNPSVAVSLAGEGVEPPQFEVSPTSLTSDLLTGQSENQLLTIANNGGADLDYDIAVDLGAQVAQYTSAGDLGKGVDDPQPGILGSGGPDNFGYQWIDSDEVGGPTFDWTDISTTGTPVYGGNYDDSNQGPFAIGFDFPFYGNSFADFRVCSNGWVSFTSTRTNYSNVPLPNDGSTIPENLLAAFWDDLYVDADIPSEVYYENDGTRMIIQFNNLRRLGQSDTAPPFYTFQVILYPNGTILYQYLTLGTLTNSATIGIQNEAKDDGLTVVYNDDYAHDDMAIRISAAPEWLSATPLAGTVAPGDTAHVNVLFNAEGLFGGRYEGAVNVNTNDPVAPHVQVPATLNVTGAPDIDVNPLALDFGQVFVGYPDLLTFHIANVGTDLLTVSSLTMDDPDFSVDYSSISLPLNLSPLQEALITVRYAPSAAGPDVGHLLIGSNDADEPTVSVDLTGEGLLAPAASVNPDSLYSDLLTGETENQTFVLTNSGGSDLTYEVQALTTFETQVVVADALDLGKDEVDPRPGILGSGGPDNFGYSWTDSDEPGGPVFDWVDISSTGTPIFSGYADDSNQGPFPVGFDFPFYGNVFNSFRASSNGFVSFTSTSSDLSNDPLPSSGGPENLLAVFWDDMVVDPSYGGEVYYEFDGSKLIIQYDSVRKYGSTTAPFYTFQILLYPNGTILYQYLTLGATLNSCTVGIQNDARDDGLNVVYNSDYLHDSMAIRIATSPDWLSANPTSGVVPPGGSVPINVHFNAAGLFGGRYEGTLRVLSNDPAHGLLDVAATMDVTGVPRVGFDPTALDFGDVYVGYSDTLDLVVSNIGTDHLSVNSMTPGLGDYSVNPSYFELDPLQSEVVKVVFAPSTDGPRNTMLTVVSNDPDSPHMVSLAGNGVLPPVMVMEPDTMEAAALPGILTTETMEMCNTGGSDLTFSMTWAEVMNGQSVQAYSYQEIPKGLDEEGAAQPVDPRPGILGSGGPDAFGYTWIDSDDPSGPSFDWIDISGVGTPFDFGGGYRDDYNSGPLPIGFSFPFYGQNYSDVRACTNGWMSFTSSATSYSNQPLPNSGAPENLLAVFWDDMVYDESYGAAAYYYYDGTKTIFQFDHIRKLGYFTAPYFSFEVILYPNGNILYQYLNLTGPLNSATIGIQNATQDDGLTVVYNGDYAHENLAILFSSRPQWLSVSPESGVVPAGECVDMTVTMDATSLDEGDYYGVIHASSNDPAHPEGEDMAVILHVRTVYATDSDIDPNTLNLSSNGKYVTGYVELPVEFDPNDVVPETVRLNGTVPADPNKVTIGDFNSNGIPDLQFKFDREDVEATLAEGDSVLVTMYGEILHTAYFWAETTIRVINPQLVSPNGGEILPVGAAVDVVWTNPDGWNVDRAEIYYSADDGVSWNLIAQDVQAETYTWMVPDNLTSEARVRVYLFDNQGVMGYDTSDDPFEITGAFTGTGPVVPIAHALKQNAPNPFLGATRIAFDLPANESVSLVIYDVSGRAVRVLERNQLPAGSYVRTWDGRDEAGHSLASGIYFYRLKAGSFTATKRMFLMK